MSNQEGGKEQTDDTGDAAHGAASLAQGSRKSGRSPSIPIGGSDERINMHVTGSEPDFISTHPRWP
jgi:hypothetical protein